MLSKIPLEMLITIKTHTYPVFCQTKTVCLCSDKNIGGFYHHFPDIIAIQARAMYTDTVCTAPFWGHDVLHVCQLKTTKKTSCGGTMQFTCYKEVLLYHPSCILGAGPRSNTASCHSSYTFGLMFKLLVVNLGRLEIAS